MKIYFRPIGKRLIIITIGSLAITGCKTATFNSTQFDLKSPPTNSVEGYGAKEGMAYFLPKGYVHIIAELQNNSTSTNLSTNKSSQVKPATNSVPSTSADAKPTSETESNKLSDTSTNEQKTVSSPYYKITVDVILEPDPKKMFLLQPQASAWANDTYGISIQNGLLTSVGSTNVDQTGGVFLKIAELAGIVATLAGASEGANHNTNSATLPTRIELTLDPDSFAAEQGQLSSSAHLILTIAPDFDAMQNIGLPIDADGESNAGIFYRPLLPYTVTIIDKNNHGAQNQTVVLMPNKSPILALVPRRSTLVTAKTSITFDRGCPTAISFDRNSPALAWFSLPLDMIKAFLSAPAELIQLKLNFATTNAQLGTQQLSDLNNQLSILKQQMAIQQFILTNSPSKN